MPDMVLIAISDVPESVYLAYHDEEVSTAMNSLSKLHLVRLVCVAAFIGAALLAGRASAQTTAEAAKIAAVLPAQQTFYEFKDPLVARQAWPVYPGAEGDTAYANLGRYLVAFMRG